MTEFKNWINLPLSEPLRPVNAAVFRSPGTPLEIRDDIPLPTPAPGKVRLRVRACGVCRTDLHLVDGELPGAEPPVIPGHQIVGTVDAVGDDRTPFALGSRVGVPWLGETCGLCRFCVSGEENLCDHPRFTGCNLDGGFAEYTVADARFCFPLPPATDYPDAQVAPLLCAGLIGFRCLRMCGADAKTIGLFGFGAAAHILVQIVNHRGGSVFGFTRPGDRSAMSFARRLGCHWVGGSDESPPEPLDAAIIFAPVGALVPTALKAVRKGGSVVCGGIHMSDIPSFPYASLWGERTVRSVANLTRQDGHEFLALAPEVPVRTHVREYDLGHVNEALEDLRNGMIDGAAVITIA